MHGYGLDDPVAAARQFVAESFASGGLVGRRLAEIVFQSDFDASAPLVAVAGRMGLSPRQFFRLRAEAVSVLALLRRQRRPLTPERAIKVLAESLAGTDPAAAAAIARITDPNYDDHMPADPCERLLSLCAFSRVCFSYGNLTGARRIGAYVEREVFNRQLSQRSAVEFELAWLAYIDAVYSRGATESCERADELFRIPEVSLEQATRRYVARAESRLRIGDWASSSSDVIAAEALTATNDTRGRAIIVAANGGAAFLKHNFLLANDCYAAVSLALSRRPVDRWICESMLVRLSRLLRRLPSMTSLDDAPSLSGGFVTLDPDDVVVLPSNPATAHGYLVLEISQLREGLAHAEHIEHSIRAMRAVLEKAASSHYASVEAMANAALADAHGRLQDWKKSEQFAGLAWSAWSRNEDRTVAVDLFAGCPQELPALLAGSRGVAELVREWIRDVHPQHPFASWNATKILDALTALRSDDECSIPRAQGEPANPYRDPVMASLAMLVEPKYRARITTLPEEFAESFARR